MPIHKNQKEQIFEVECDDCGEIETYDIEDFSVLIDVLNEEGWKKRKISSGWENICPDCNKK